MLAKSDSVEMTLCPLWEIKMPKAEGVGVCVCVGRGEFKGCVRRDWICNYTHRGHPCYVKSGLTRTRDGHGSVMRWLRDWV